MTELVDFILARVAEDEALARSATAGDRTGNWWLDPDEGGITEVSCLEVQGFVTAVDQDAAHIVRHSPASVLRECEAKRRIVEQAGEASGDRGQVIQEFAVGDAEVDDMYASDPGELILRALASVYAEHPDYRPEWSPDA